jgi:hypothetical protein
MLETDADTTSTVYKFPRNPQDLVNISSMQREEARAKANSINQHRIAQTVKTVIMLECHAVGFGHGFKTSKRRHQHQ